MFVEEFLKGLQILGILGVFSRTQNSWDSFSMHLFAVGGFGMNLVVPIFFGVCVCVCVCVYIFTGPTRRIHEIMKDT